MSVWNIIILSGAAGAALVAWGSNRCLWCIFALVTSYAISVIYWDLGGQYGEFVAGVCDLVVVAAIAWNARHLWELWVGLIFLGMALTNWIYLGDNLAGAHVISHDFYSSVLEIFNVAALFLIGGAASFHKAGMRDGLAFHPWLFSFGGMRHAISRIRSRD